MSKIIVDGEVMELPDSGGVNFTIDKTLTMSEDNVLGVTVPTKGVTKEEFDQMSNEEKKGHIIVIDESPFIPVGTSLQEYDTEIDGCNWHVRKYSNGYVEMSGIKNLGSISYNVESSAIKGMYSCGEQGLIKYPIVLTKKYCEIDAGVSNNPGGYIILTMQGGKTDDFLIRSNRLFLLREATTAVNTDIHVFVTGRWKE